MPAGEDQNRTAALQMSNRALDDNHSFISISGSEEKMAVCVSHSLDEGDIA